MIYQKIEELLGDSGANVNLVDSKFSTPFIYAIRTGNMAIIDRLLKHPI